MCLHKWIYRIICAKSYKTTKIGSDEASWNLLKDSIQPHSHCISGGVGQDISFEIELTESTGCNILLLDPSPTGQETVTRHTLPKNIQFLNHALSSRSGTIRLARPLEKREGSWRISTDGSGDEMTAVTLENLMQQKEIHHIDLLKIDIEGFEYEVLHQLLDHQLDVRQICVEIHHGPTFGKSRWQKWKLIFRLLLSGYILIHHHQWDHTFIRESAVVV